MMQGVLGGSAWRMAASTVVLAGLIAPLSASQSRAASSNKAPLANAAAVVSAGNQFYRVFVETDPNSGGLGLYTATTGPQHPAGDGQNVLFGNGAPGTTFNTIRSYTSATDYVQESGKSSGNTVVSLSAFGSVAPIGTTGFRTTYALPGPPTTPDALTIVQDVNVNGTDFQSSTVEVTTVITNTGTAAVALGIRYLWDFEIAFDDGPTFRATNPNGPVLVTEAQFASPTFESYRIQDNDVNPNPPTFDVLGTVVGPAFIVPPPTAPALLQFVSWPGAINTAFDYTVDPLLNIADENAPSNINDSAVLYFFGPNSQNPINVGAATSTTVSASLFLTLPVPTPTSSAPALGSAAMALLAFLLGGTGVLIVSRRFSK
jgi:hypothetical protein